MLVINIGISTDELKKKRNKIKSLENVIYIVMYKCKSIIDVTTVLLYEL